MDKRKLYAACILQQKEEVENFESRVNSLKADVNAHEHSASQTEERTAGNLDLLRNYEKELTFSRNEMTHLQSLDPSITHSKIEPGAVVLTDKLNFYISIPLDKIEIDGTTFIGISNRAPIYTAMENKLKGDTFKFNETEYAILDVF